jgi:hypothetical protein
MILFEKKYTWIIASLIGQLLLIVGTVFVVNWGMERRVSKELRNIRQSLEQIKQNEVFLSQDVNQARAVLGLPERYYEISLALEDSPPEEKEEKSGRYLLLYRAVDTLISKQEKEKRTLSMMNVLNASETKQFLQSAGITLKNKEGKVELVKNGLPYFTCTAEKSAPFEILSYLGAKFVPKTSGSEELISFLKEQIPLLDSHAVAVKKLRSKFLSSLSKPAVTSAAASRGLIQSPVKETEEALSVSYGLRSEPTLTKVEAGLDLRKGTLFLGKEPFDSVEEFEKALENSLRNADTRNSKEIHIDSIYNSVSEYVQDKGFQQYLDSKGLLISNTGREDNDHRYIDLLSKTGERIGSLGIQKDKGEVFLFDADDVPISSLRMFSLPSTGETKKKTLNSSLP